ncbi:MAG: transposase [Planctomycetes bacterium]|nr:transposase [Planctomycetota bacterium]
MTIARAHLVDPTRAGAYHLVNRCVRRSFLCGDRCEHRRQWVHDLIREHAALFAIDICAYAVMANHFHLVVITHPERCAAWSPEVVALHWAAIFPKRASDGAAMPADPAELARRSADSAWVAKHRERLGSVSWFMKVMKERLARRANREDGCTGSFWQGRFTSVALLDQAALIACMAYVDLNPIRAKQAETPETSRLTSIHDRIAARQSHRIAMVIQTRNHTEDAITDASGRVEGIPGPEQGIWIAPLAACTPTSEALHAIAPCPLSLDVILPRFCGRHDKRETAARMIHHDHPNPVPVLQGQAA